MNNGLRPTEILEALDAAERAAQAQADGSTPVLGTLVSIDGSVDARSGALAVFMAGEMPGAIPVCELAGELRAALEETAASGRARLLSVSLAEDDPLLGFGLGAPGAAELFLEPVDPALRASLRELGEALSSGRGLVYSLAIEGSKPGQRRILPPDDPAGRECYEQRSPELIEEAVRGGVSRTFLCPIHSAPTAMVFGSGPAAQALAVHLADLGLAVLVADSRPGRLRQARLPRERLMLVEGGWEQARRALRPDEQTAIVILTRSYALDLETLQGALQSPAAYVGLAATAPRAQRMLRELDALGVRPRPGVFFAPAGLDVGAETPRETALAIAAEILAARAGRKGGRLSSRAKPATAGHARTTVPGLILAAGRGRRFAGGHKLSASFLGKPILRHAVENALASRLDPVIVVLGCEADAALRALGGLDDPRLRVVFNPRWQGGKGSSIECGLREVPGSASGVVSLLGDMPRVAPWLIDRVIAEFELSPRLVFPVHSGPGGPVRGYPTAFPRSLFGAIRALTGDDTAAEAVREHWSQAVKIPLDDASTQADVDTPQDLQLLLNEPG